MTRFKRCRMHTKGNIAVLPVILGILLVSAVVVPFVAESVPLVIFGEAVAVGLALLMSAVFLFRFRLLDSLVFADNELLLVPFIGKKIAFVYTDYVGKVGLYTSSAEAKPYIILSPRRLGVVCDHVDTSKYGNCMALNCAFVLYCPLDERLVLLLKQKGVLFEE